MTDSIRRRDAGSCRLPGDENEHDETKQADAKSAAESEKSRPACMLDVDWNEKADETPFGPPRPPPPPSPSPTTNNATRTQERHLTTEPYAAAGSADGGHTVYAGAAIIKGRDANGGDVEAMSVSVQVGRQHEVQATALRVGFSDARVTISAEAGTANAHAGFRNADGSTGVNTGLGAVTAAAEGTFGDGANSVTVGIGAGIGAEGSLGVRDKDGDGKPEVCFRLGVKFATVGACVELPFHGKM